MKLILISFLINTLALGLVGFVNAQQVSTVSIAGEGEGYFYGEPAYIKYTGTHTQKKYNQYDRDFNQYYSYDYSEYYEGYISLREGELKISFGGPGKSSAMIGPQMVPFDVHWYKNTYPNAHILSIWTTSFRLYNKGPITEVGRFVVKHNTVRE